MLSLNNINLFYGKHQVLNNLTVNFNEGKLYGIIGPNGAGKSTLLNVIAKDLRASSGEVYLHGESISEIKPKHFAQKLAYMRQKTEVRFPYTVWELVAMGRYCYESGTRKEDDQIILDKIKENDLEDYLHKSVTEMSGGEVQRAFFAKVLAQDSDVILVDEGLSNADIFHKVKFFEQLRQEVNKGKLVIMVLHDLFLARKFCDELLILNRDGIYDFGKSDMVLDKKALKEVFMVQGDFINNALVLE